MCLGLLSSFAKTSIHAIQVSSMRHWLISASSSSSSSSIRREVPRALEPVSISVFALPLSSPSASSSNIRRRFRWHSRQACLWIWDRYWVFRSSSPVYGALPEAIRKPKLWKRNNNTYGLSLCLWQVVMIVLLGSKRGSFHLLPDYGTILPSTGATFCHCQAQNDTSGERFQPVYHFHLPEAFWLLEGSFCL